MTYHKIQTVFLRDPDTKFKTLLEGQFAQPEFEYLQNNNWVFTEKVDGTNIRVMWSKEQMSFGGKTDNAQIPSPLMNRLSDRFVPLVEKFVKMFGGSDVVLYGEGYGAKIQKGGGNYRQDQDFVLFDVNINGIWLERENVLDIASSLGIDAVPIIGDGSLWIMVKLCRDGFNSTWGDFQAEGIVARPETEMLTRTGDRIITKLKSKDFKDNK